MTSFSSRHELIDRGSEYCRRRQSQLEADQVFGYGVHGSVFACLRATAPARSAVKVHEREEPYHRERDTYLRLRELSIESVQKHNVPQLLDYDDELLVIEMTIVARPFLLDFGGAYLDHPPDYSAEVLD